MKIKIEIHECPEPEEGGGNLTDEEAMAMGLALQHGQRGGMAAAVLMFDLPTETFTLRAIMPTGIATPERIEQAKSKMALAETMLKMAGASLDLHVERPGADPVAVKLH